MLKLIVSFLFGLVVIPCALCSQEPDYSPTPIDEVKRDVAQNPDNLRARYLLGKLLIHEKDFESGISHWKYVLRLRPKLTMVQFEIGVVYYKMGRSNPSSAEKLKCWGKALRIWKGIEGDQDDESDIIERRNRRKAKNAWLKLRAKYAALENQLDHYSPTQPSHHSGGKGKYTEERLVNLEAEAIGLFINEEYPAAASSFGILRTNGYNLRSTIVYLGKAFLMDGEDPEKAVTEFKAYVTKFRPTAYILQNLGQAYGLCADSINQIKYLEKSLAFKPESVTVKSTSSPSLMVSVDAPIDKGYVHVLLAQAYDSISNTRKTMKHSIAAVKINPDNKALLMELLKGSNVIEVIMKLVDGIMNGSKDGRPSDGKLDQFAEEINKLWGEDLLDFDEDEIRDY